MTIDPTRKIIIRVSIISLLFLGITFGVLVPTLLRIRKTSEESLKLRLFLEDKYQQSLNSRITRKKLTEIKSAVANFNNFIFKTQDELQLITFLENLAAKNNVVPTITSSNLDKIGDSHLADISLDLKGNYYNILKYISELESSNYFIKIQQLQLTPNFTKDGDPSPMVNLSITTELYVNQ